MILGPAIDPWGPGTNETNCFVVWWLIVELSQWHTSTREVSHLYYPYFVSIYPVYPVLEFVFCFKYLQTAMRKNLMILNDYPVVFRDWNCRPDFVHMGWVNIFNYPAGVARNHGFWPGLQVWCTGAHWTIHIFHRKIIPKHRVPARFENPTSMVVTLTGSS